LADQSPYSLSVDHIGIVVDSLAAARAFATEVLGLQETRSIELRELGMTAVFYRCGDCELEFIEVWEPSRRDRRLPAGAIARVEHVALRVDNLETVLGSFASSGARWSSAPGGDTAAAPTPLEAAGGLNVWSDPETTLGVMWQLVNRSPAASETSAPRPDADVAQG
jgi:catechol 2,3-dioxygenase-like lactoylglutathione lyase family enzyme